MEVGWIIQIDLCMNKHFFLNESCVCLCVCGATSKIYPSSPSSGRLAIFLSHKVSSSTGCWLLQVLPVLLPLEQFKASLLMSFVRSVTNLKLRHGSGQDILYPYWKKTKNKKTLGGCFSYLVVTVQEYQK